MGKVQINSLIERIGNLLRSEERAVGTQSGLQSVHIQILKYLSHCNRYSNTPMGITEFLGATKGTISQSINILENKGFIDKVPDREDRRVVHLELTKKGKLFIENLNPPLEYPKTLDLLNIKETEVFSKLLTKMLINLQRINNGRIFGVCYSCRYFKKNGLGEDHQCGLTDEPLSEDESPLICREYEEPSQKAV